MSELVSTSLQGLRSRILKWQSVGMVPKCQHDFYRICGWVVMSRWWPYSILVVEVSLAQSHGYGPYRVVAARRVRALRIEFGEPIGHGK